MHQQGIWALTIMDKALWNLGSALVFIDSAYSCNALQAWALATGRDLLANQRYTTQQGNLIRRYHYHIYATVSPLVVLVILWA